MTRCRSYDDDAFHYDNDNFYMSKLKAVMRGLWQLASFLFWPQKNKRGSYDDDNDTLSLL